LHATAGREPRRFIPLRTLNIPTLSRPPFQRLLALAGTFLAILVTGCTSTKPARPTLQEKFGSEETFSRLMPAPPAQSCEAARRALLSQGYILVKSQPDLIDAKKSFQPAPEAQQEMMIRVVCLPETPADQLSLVFVTAIQDTYTLKKSNTSASLGVGGVGSVSLPFASSSEALVKVGSETISSDAFYDSFFALVRRFLTDELAGKPD